MTPLERRQKHTQATLAKFGARAFRWGACDCAKIAAFHLRKFRWVVPKTGGYRTAEEATARLAALGCDSLPDLAEKVGLPEIAPAYAIIGDIVSFAADHALGALGIVVGNGNMLAFHEARDIPVIMTMDRIDRAWSVLPVEPR